VPDAVTLKKVVDDPLQQSTNLISNVQDGAHMSLYRWFGVALILICPAWAIAQSAPRQAEPVAGNQQDILRISGSIYPTVILPSRAKASAPPPSIAPARVAEAEEAVTSVCLASASSADQCGIGMSTASATGSSHMAYCDVDDVGFAKCLSRYARVLVRHPSVSKQSLYVEVLNSQGTRETLTVLAAAPATNEQIAAAIRKDRPDVTIATPP
jgi:hypothetical protein